MTPNPVLTDLNPNPALARLVVEEHFRGLSLVRRLALAVRMVLLSRPARVPTLEADLSNHLRHDLGLPARYERVDPPHWYPPPMH
ncbi:hypothetical protein [Arenibacterium sp. LLYu02]|uniref:hypothetical protein n=1 Tax=Arenibacterium sp. LLYu02 TaxID=3404132 RepID=UPI003B213B03